MVTDAEKATRRWHVTAYRRPVGDDEKGAQVTYDGTAIGDRELDAITKGLERRTDFLRVAAEPETLGNRQTRVEPDIEPPPDLSRYLCRQCDRPEVECRRRAATSGHEFEIGEPRW